MENTLEYAVERMLSGTTPVRLSSSLRSLLVDYLFYNMDGLPVGFATVLEDYEKICAFLEEIVQ